MDGLTKFSKPTLFVFHGKSVHMYVQYCTDGNTDFGCDSDKKSLIIIYMF